MTQRDPLARTRRDNTRERMQRQRDAMTVDQVEVAMEKVIRGRLEISEPISLDDFRRANLPMKTVENRFEHVLARIREATAS